MNSSPNGRAPVGRRRILLVGKLPPPYFGPALATQILLQSSLAERFDVVHVNSSVHDGLDTVGTFDARKILKHARVYVDFLSQAHSSKPDVVIVPISQSTIGFLKDSVLVLLARMVGARVLVQLRGGNLRNWLRTTSPPTRAYVEGVLGLADGAIVLGRRLRRQFEGLLPDDRIFVVPNGADYAFNGRASEHVQPAPGVRLDTSLRPDTIRLLYLGNLQPSKGIEDVIGAMEILRQWRVTGFRLDVVGSWRDEETRRRCLRRVEAADLPVVFHGPAYGKEKMAFLTGADVFVFTPRVPEGHPWVVVEALAAGLPIVTTAQGAIPESVVNGRNGFVVLPERPDLIADRLRMLVADSVLRQAQSDASRRHYREHYTEAHMVDRFSRAVEGVLTA